MPSSGRGPRHRRRRRRSSGGGLTNHREAYLLCLGSIATCCVAAAVLILIVRPSWTSHVLRLPLGAYLLGGLGGVLTLAGSPDWSRRIGLRHPARIACLTFYRLGAACLLGAIGYALFGELSGSSGQVFPGWVGYACALAFGVIESALNGATLEWLGMLEPRKEAGTGSI